MDDGNEDLLAAFCRSTEREGPAGDLALERVLTGRPAAEIIARPTPVTEPEGPFRCPRLRCTRRADGSELRPRCRIFAAEMLRTPWRLLVIDGPPGDERDAALANALRSAALPHTRIGPGERPAERDPETGTVVWHLPRQRRDTLRLVRDLLSGCAVILVAEYWSGADQAAFEPGTDLQVVRIERARPPLVWDEWPDEDTGAVRGAPPPAEAQRPGEHEHGRGPSAPPPSDDRVDHAPYYYDDGWLEQELGVDEPPYPPPRPAGARQATIIVADATGQPTAGSVEPGRPYVIRLSIGAPRSASIVRPPAPFPTRLLGPTHDGWWLHAVLSEDGSPIGDGAFFLPAIGDSFVCPCPPGSGHTCGPRDRFGWLDLGVTAPIMPGQQRLQLAVHLGAATIQAFEITVSAGVADIAPPIARAVYTLSTDLVALSRFAGRSMSIRTGDAGPGMHYLVVNAERDLRIGFSFADAQAGTAARGLRAVLFDRQLRARRRGWDSRYDGGFGKPAAEYEADLRALARAGAEAFTALLPDPDARELLSDGLAAATDRPAVIQVAQAQGSRPVIPWQLIYDEPIISDADDLHVCPSVLEFGPGAPARDVPGRCPHADGHGRYPGTLCPFGFWGLANILEVPPSSRWLTLAGVTGAELPPSVVVALNATFGDADLDAHLAMLDRVGGATRRSVVTTDVGGMREAVRDGADLLYFLCHGRRMPGAGSAEPAMALDLGRGGRITAQDVAQWASLVPRVRWTDRRPLVVLNGCHTGERLPETLTDFASAFVESTGAAGVLATEVAMERRLACYLMDAFVAAWGEGQGVGAALRSMRWKMLGRGNVMGLAYSPYCDADLRLPRSERWPA